MTCGSLGLNILGAAPTIGRVSEEFNGRGGRVIGERDVDFGSNGGRTVCTGNIRPMSGSVAIEYPVHQPPQLLLQQRDDHPRSAAARRT